MAERDDLDRARLHLALASMQARYRSVLDTLGLELAVLPEKKPWPTRRRYTGPLIFGREVPGWDTFDALRQGEPWSEARDYMPSIRIRLELGPWHWRIRPRFDFVDDRTWWLSFEWLPLEIEVVA